MNKWVAVVVLDLMVLTAAVALRAVTTGAQTRSQAPSAKIIVGPAPW